MLIKNLKIIRKLLSQCIGWMGIVLVAGVSWIYAIQYDIFTHSNTIITGNDFYSDKDILSILPVDDKVSIFQFKPDEIQNNLNELDFIYKSNVSLLPPSTLVIQLTERIPLVYIKNSNDQYLIDETGKILPVTSQVKDHFNAPMIEKTDLLPFAELYKYEFDIRDYSEIISFIKISKATYPTFYSKITYIKQLPDDFEFSYGINNTRIYLTKQNAYNELSYIQEFEKVIQKNKVFEDFQYIDVRIPDQIIVRERRKNL